MSSGTPTDNAYDPLPTQRSRELRINATPAERKLWSVLSNRQLCGVRFNRQVVIRPFICDLVARSAKLVIEIDGGQHGEAIAYDQARTAFLETKGYRVLRFWNNDVLENIEGVVTSIEQTLLFPPPARASSGAFGSVRGTDLRPNWEEPRSGEGEGLCSTGKTSPPPLASRVDPSRSGGRGK